MQAGWNEGVYGTGDFLRDALGYSRLGTDGGSVSFLVFGDEAENDAVRLHRVHVLLLRRGLHPAGRLCGARAGLGADPGVLFHPLALHDGHRSRLSRRLLVHGLRVHRRVPSQHPHHAHRRLCRPFADPARHLRREQGAEVLLLQLPRRLHVLDPGLWRRSLPAYERPGRAATTWALQEPLRRSRPARNGHGGRGRAVLPRAVHRHDHAWGQSRCQRSATTPRTCS